MSENRKQILEMLSDGKISADEADRLLGALGENTLVGDKSARPKAKYLRIVVESEDGHHPHKHPHHGHGEQHGGPVKVNIRVPLQFLRAGVKLASLIPVQAQQHVNEALREHGMKMDLSQLKPENLEELVDHLQDLTVDVDERSNKVRIFCE